MAKEYMIIDGQRVELDGEKNILAVIRKAGIELPTFCYYTELSIYGACRMCVVEDERGGIIASCSTPPRHKMSVKTNTPKLQKHRKMVLELLLSSHCRDCTTCQKSGKCRLQELAKRFNIRQVRFDNNDNNHKMDTSSASIVRDTSKCILCGDCVRMCSEIQGIGAIDFVGRGSKMRVAPFFNMPIADSNCVNCGQCAAVCPTGAIVIKRETRKVWDAIYDPNKRVVASIAPAVRVALGEEFGVQPGENVMGKIVAALHRLGCDAVYDTVYAADLTVLEESAEFLNRLQNGGKLPLFTSCCPAWIRFAEKNHPELLENISSCRSPQQMFGSLIKEYHRVKETQDTREIMHVSVMPCTAKKFEAARDEFKVDGVPDVDCVITTQELAAMIREAGIIFDELQPEAPDMPFGIGTGAGVIFGVTGGVTEAVIRRVFPDQSASGLQEISYTGVRGMEGTKEAVVEVDENTTLRIAVVNGLANTERLIQRLQAGEVSYDIIEVMACPGGCIGGAGQPTATTLRKQVRADGLYAADKMTQMKRSQENIGVKGLYRDLLKGDRSHELLHTRYTAE